MTLGDILIALGAGIIAFFGVIFAPVGLADTFLPYRGPEPTPPDHSPLAEEHVGDVGPDDQITGSDE